MQHAEKFKRPVFRSSVDVSVVGGAADITYKDQGCTIEVKPELAKEFQQFLVVLQKGLHSNESLHNIFPNISSEIEGIIEEFDRLGLLTESEFEHDKKSLKGSDFYHVLRSYCDELHYGIGDSPLYNRMLSNAVTRNELIGYAIEYFHLVKAAPQVLAPALAHDHSATVRAAVMNLFLEEHDHEHMLRSALKSTGLNDWQIDHCVPLPKTFAAYSALSTLARQHFLSFAGALFLFEEPSPLFNTEFRRSCERMGLPEAFYAPILRHSGINEEASHGNITAEIFSAYEAISFEEGQIIKLNAGTMLETIVGQDAQIVKYYGLQGMPARIVD